MIKQSIEFGVPVFKIVKCENGGIHQSQEFDGFLSASKSGIFVDTTVISINDLGMGIQK